MLTVRVGDIFVRGRNKVRRNENRIFCQLDPGAEVCGVVGEVPGSADFLCFLAAGASVFLAADRFLLVAAAGC